MSASSHSDLGLMTCSAVKTDFEEWPKKEDMPSQRGGPGFDSWSDMGPTYHGQEAQGPTEE